MRFVPVRTLYLSTLVRAKARHSLLLLVVLFRFTIAAPVAAQSGIGVATPASATPNPVTDTSATLSVLGTDGGGEASLTYTWSATGPASVTFAGNGTNGSKNTTATFRAPGSYNVTVLIADSGGLTTTSTVAITVNQTPAAVTVNPPQTSVNVQGTQQFSAVISDQFGNEMAPPGGTQGWNTLPNTMLQSVCPPDFFGGQNYPFNFDCHGVIRAWSGGIIDTLRNRMIIWGGGHLNYFGNELYSLNLNDSPPSLRRLTDPSPINTDLSNCTPTLADGKPNARETYNNLVYMTHLDKMFVFNGANACGGGNGASDTWTLDMSTLQWTRMDPVNGFAPPFNLTGVTNYALTAYDPNTRTVLVVWDGQLWRYTYETNTYDLLSTEAPASYAATGALDTKRNLFVFMGHDYQSSAPSIWTLDVSGNSPYVSKNISSQVSGCDAIGSAGYPGLVYDPVLDRIVGWPNTGSTLYLFNPDTMTCTTQTFANGPTSPVRVADSGTFGRFNYMPTLGEYVLVNDSDQNAYTLGMTSAPTKVTWFVDGGGTISSSGLFAAGKTPGGPYHVSARIGTVGGSGGITVTGAAITPVMLLMLKSDATEVSGVTNGSVVTPTIAPAGFKGSVSVNGIGSVNFAPGQSGTGVTFLNCCVNTNNAYYKFTGPTVGNIFNVNQGQISFSLKSSYSFAQRTNLVLPRFVFDVRDDNPSNHVFQFLTEVSSGQLLLEYTVNGTVYTYYVPQGTEDALFGAGVTMNVSILWDGARVRLYLNNSEVQVSSSSTAVANWTSSSVFDLGAYEYLSFGGYYSCDDLINNFTVTGPAIVLDTTPPTVTMTAPTAGSVSGTVTVSANAADNVAVAKVQFLLDGANLGTAISGAGPYSVSWNTTGVANGPHVLAATATDTAGNSATGTSVSVTVSNAAVPPAISSVAASVTSATATVTWTTDQASSSQVTYGTTAGYGSQSALNSTLVTSHSATLTGLAASTMYHYQVQSQTAQGGAATSADMTFTTAAAATQSTPLLQIQGSETEVSGVTNGSVVTPSIGPAGFTGAVAVNGTGSVNFAPAQSGTGVYFLNCCVNTNNAYYKFTGTNVGSIFNVNPGQISFSLKSSYSFAQRQALIPRFVFDVRDNDPSNHVFSFLTEVASGALIFAYTVNGTGYDYYAPQGTENALFGNGVTLNVTIAWTGNSVTLYLNGNPVQSNSFTTATPNWTSSSVFDLGAYEYLSFGGYYTCDDLISNFTVAGTPAFVDTTPPTVTMTAPTAGSVSGTVTVSANATDNVAVAKVQFLLDGANLGTAISGAGPYSVSWNTTGVANGPHVLAATATDTAGNSATGTSVSVTVSNAAVPPAISSVAASVTSATATVTWTTDQASSSQVTYGTTAGYGSQSALNSTLVTSHSATLTGLAASTMYHYQVQSQTAQGGAATSADMTFTTAAAATQSTPLLQIQGSETEVSGVTNGSVVTPSIGPAGFTGAVAVNGTGSVNFAPAQSGTGVYFLNCCVNTNNAYYKFTGTNVGSIFNVNPGQISFSLKSSYSFAQRQALIPRFVFDVRDNDPSNHVFSFLTEVASGALIFAYTVNGTGYDYYAPQGTENALFGNGVTLNVTIAWTGNSVTLYLNGNPVQSNSFTTATPNWTSSSVFDLGAYEYLSFGGYYTCDDLISNFTVAGTPAFVDTTPPTVTMTAPTAGSVSGTVTVSANATDNVAVAKVQFLLDGANLGTAISGAGPYSVSWNTTGVANGPHVLAATATDTAGNSATGTSVSVTVSNAAVPPAISSVAASVTSATATVTWTTDQASSSQVTYGTTAGYGSQSALNSTLVTSHSATLTGLAASTMYHYQVQSQTAQGGAATSADMTFTTAAAATQSTPLLQIQGSETEVSGVTNGSVVTPSIGPAGFTGAVAVNGTGSVNFAPAQSGTGVYFLNCCVNTNNAYYKFTGTNVGSIFNVNPGQISFSLKSSYSFAQRQALIPRFVFDVRDNDPGNHVFYFLTNATSAYLAFSYRVGGTGYNYYVPQGSEDSVFGNGVTVKVTITWDGSTVKLCLNDNLVQSSPYNQVAANWTSSSVFDLGAYEYLSFGGYYACDDLINEFTVSGQ
jgi:hypothetical protein